MFSFKNEIRSWIDFVLYIVYSTHGKLTCKYRLINQVSEYWYIGSMLARSEIQKNRMEEWIATGL